MISWKQKRCATSVQSIWRWYRAEISTMCQKTKVFVLDKFLWVKNIFRYQDPGTARHGNIWHGTDHEGTARKSAASRQGRNGRVFNKARNMRNLRNLRNLRGFRLSGGLPSGVRFHSKIVQKWGSHFRPPFQHFWGP